MLDTNVLVVHGPCLVDAVLQALLGARRQRQVPSMSRVHSPVAARRRCGGNRCGEDWRVAPTPAAEQTWRDGPARVQPGWARPTTHGIGGLGEGFRSERCLDPGTHSIEIDPDGRQRIPV